jgi:hypothetical protein
MTSRNSASAPRLYRHQEATLSLQLLPRSIPIGLHSPSHSDHPHRRSQSSSRYPRFEESSVNEKSGFDGVAPASHIKAETSAPRVVDPDPLSLHHHHQSYPSSSSSSIRHLTSHQSTDYSLSPIADTMSSHFALPLPSLHSGYLHPPRKIRLLSIVKPWIPVLAYLSTSLGFLIAIAFWKTQVFQGAHYDPVIPSYVLSPCPIGGS